MKMKDSSFIVVTIFSSALAHALSCVGKPDMVLKDKQVEALILKHLYDGSDVFLYIASLSVSRCFHSCLM